MEQLTEGMNQRSQALNRQALADVSSGDRMLERDLLATFYESAPQMLEELRTAVFAEDFDQINYQAHKLKGSTKAIGAEAASAASMTVEFAAKSGDRLSLPVSFGLLNRHMNRLLDEIGRILQEPDEVGC